MFPRGRPFQLLAEARVLRRAERNLDPYRPWCAVPNAPLAFQISGSASIDHEFLAKRNGPYILALWNETESWNRTTHRPIHVPAEAVAVRLPFNLKDVSGRKIGDTGALEPTSVLVSGDTLATEVDDHVTFVSFGAAAPRTLRGRLR